LLKATRLSTIKFKLGCDCQFWQLTINSPFWNTPNIMLLINQQFDQLDVIDINVETSWHVMDINFHDQIQVGMWLSVLTTDNQLSVLSKPTSTPSFACAKVAHIINYIEMSRYRNSQVTLAGSSVERIHVFLFYVVLLALTSCT
jgi:hypothetical protein